MNHVLILPLLLVALAAIWFVSRRFGAKAATVVMFAIFGAILLGSAYS